MALSGDLAEFPLSDTFMLLSQQKKTGKLSLHDQDESVEIEFLSGHIIGIKFNQETPLSKIGSSLIQQGLTTRSAFKMLVDSVATTEVKLSQTLIAKGFLSAEECNYWFSSAAEDLVTGLFLWKKGKYQFTAEPFRGEPKLLEYNLATDFLIFEGLRQMDEYSKVHEPFQTSKTIQIEKSDFEEYDMGPDLFLMRRIKNGMSVSQLESYFPFGLFRLRSRLLNLQNEGFIKLVNSQHSANYTTGNQKTKTYGPVLFAILCFLILLVALVFRFTWAPALSVQMGSYFELGKKWKQERTEILILEYCTKKGKHPSQLGLKN